jgi:hypothetical protein
MMLETHFLAAVLYFFVYSFFASFFICSSSASSCRWLARRSLAARRADSRASAARTASCAVEVCEGGADEGEDARVVEVGRMTRVLFGRAEESVREGEVFEVGAARLEAVVEMVRTVDGWIEGVTRWMRSRSIRCSRCEDAILCLDSRSSTITDSIGAMGNRLDVSGGVMPALYRSILWCLVEMDLVDFSGV